MPVAALYNVPGTPEQLAEWAHAHAAHHRDVGAALLALTNYRLVDYVLDPINPDDMGTWLQQHQELHAILDQAIAAQNNNLLDVDWKSPEQLSAWIELNAEEHRVFSEVFGVA